MINASLRPRLGTDSINFKDSQFVGFVIHLWQRRFAMRDLFWLTKEQLALIGPFFLWHAGFRVSMIGA